MRNYKAYLIGADGRIRDRIEFACPDDEEARKQADQLADGCAVELWDGGRKIANFEPRTS